MQLHSISRNIMIFTIFYDLEGCVCLWDPPNLAKSEAYEPTPPQSFTNFFCNLLTLSHSLPLNKLSTLIVLLLVNIILFLSGRLTRILLPSSFLKPLFYTSTVMAVRKVYGSLDSPATLKVLACLFEHHLDFEFVPVDISASDNRKKPFLNMSVKLHGFLVFTVKITGFAFSFPFISWELNFVLCVE